MAHGICATLFDPDKRIFATPALAADLDAIAPGMPIRVAIRSDAKNHLDLAAFAKALTPYKGRPIYGLLDLDFNRPWLEGNPSRLFYADEPLGYGGNKRQNRWIQDSCKKMQETVQALSPFIDHWIIHNEADLMGTISIGANDPPVQGDKAPSLAPEVFYSYCYEAAGWLKLGGAKTVTVGALSWLPFSGDDDKNPYDGGYMRKGLSYLKGTRANHFAWDSLALNCEGAWTTAKAQAMAKEVAHCLKSVGLALPLIISEWSWQNGNGANPATAIETAEALGAISSLMFFFQHLCRTPDNPKDYGLRLWRVVDGGFYPAFGPLSWYPIFRDIVAHH